VTATLRLGYLPPFDWAAILGFLGPRAIAGVERAEGTVYSRVFRHAGEPCRISVRDAPGRKRLVIEVHGDVDSKAIAQRLRRAFDLDADPSAIGAAFSGDPLLAPLVAARPGLRVPGCLDPFELVVRAVLGQQISVAGARTLAGRIAERWGTALPDSDWRLFPDAETLAGADLTAVGVMPARARTLATVSRVVADDPGFFDRTAQVVSEDLLALPGIGPWTAQYVGLRALGDRDAFPASDLGLLKAAADGAARPTPKALARRSEAWRPFRGYAALHLWNAGG
jgi:AraC family transcriptional regulator of adaptative response / DNA-3-methyladenine glycosylase II